jgi:hypothetical protein
MRSREGARAARPWDRPGRAPLRPSDGGPAGPGRPDPYQPYFSNVMMITTEVRTEAMYPMTTAVR